MVATTTSPPPLLRLSALSLLAHGDFSTSLASLPPHAPLAVARLPHRQIFFLSDPALVAEAALTRAPALRDRQDVTASGGGIVNGCGAAWSRRRERLRILQQPDGLESLAAPAVASAIAACGCPPYALLLPPAEMLPWSGRLVRHALRKIAIASDDGPLEADDPMQLQTGRRRSRSGASGLLLLPLRVLLAPLLAPLAWLFTRSLMLLARFSLLCEHSALLSQRYPFFDVAEQFTNRRRKEERRATKMRARLRKGLALWRRRKAAAGGEGSVSDWVRDVVRTREEAPHPSNTAPARDVLDALLTSKEEGSGGSTRLGHDEMVGVLMDVLTAGGDTTSTTLSTAALLMQKHPEVAGRVAEEAKEVFGSLPLGCCDEAAIAGAMASAIGQQSRSNGNNNGCLGYTKAVVMEASRLYPAAPLLLRVALNDTSIGGYELPKGSGVVASTSLLGRHPSAWEQPEEFIPERFLPGHPLYRSAEAGKAYMSFGAGPRSCIGQQLAVAIASLALAWMVNEAASEGLLEAV